MKFAAAFALATLMALSPAQAALSGYYDSVEQIHAILSSGDLADVLRQAPITSIERSDRIGDGLVHWEVESEGCTVPVALRPVLPQGVGKTTYQVQSVGKCE